MSQTAKIIALGGGTIGPSTAMLLAKQHHNVTAFERGSRLGKSFVRPRSALMCVSWRYGLRYRQGTRAGSRTCSPVPPRAGAVDRARTKSLPIAQKQAGWSRLQMAYLSGSDEEVRDAMLSVAD